MKKTVLFMVAIGFGLAMIAQDGKYCKRPPHAIQDGMANPNKVANTTSGTQKNGNPDALNVTACDTTGHAGNAYGSFTRGSRSLLYFDPNLNTLIYTHRSAPTIDATANTGHIMFDQSTDGGLTWTMQRGPVYTPGAELGRYPQGVIYNPPSNTNPANAFMSGFGPCTNGSGWVAHWAAAASLGGTLNPNQQVFTFGGPYQGLIPYNADVQQDGTVWIAEMSYDGADYMDTTYVIKGVWNNTLMRHDYTTIKVKTNVNQDLGGVYNFAYAGVAFAPTGGTGYLTIMAHDDFTLFPDSAYYLIVRKTTDAGVTWQPPVKICMSNLDSLVGVGPGTVYTTGFDFDPIVDANGNLHISVIGSPSSYPGAGWSVPTNSRKIAMDVYTIDGGNTWKAKKLGDTQTFRGNFGSTPIGEDNRPQVSATWDRSRLVFSWFDTDTVQFGNMGNIFPDHHMVAFNATTGMWSAEMITTTGGTCADGITTFGSVPQYLSYNSGTIGVPLSYMVLINNDDLAVCQFRFGEGITVTDAQINLPGNAIYPCLTIGMGEYNGLFTIGNPFPNPTSDVTALELNLTKSSQVSVIVTNAIGQNVMNVMNEQLTAGKHEISIDANKFQTGIYFITVNAGGYTISKKLVVN